LVAHRSERATEGSVVSRRAGPASAGRAATRTGIRRPSGDAQAVLPDACSNARSVHDSPLTSRHPDRSRFRLRRTACAGSNRIEIASTGPREGDGMARSETPSLDPSPPCRAERLPESVLRRRPGCPPLASRTRAPFGIRTAGDDCNRSLQPRYDARARRLSSKSSPAPGCRPVRVSTG
jgi:hypothetical protein